MQYRLHRRAPLHRARRPVSRWVGGKVTGPTVALAPATAAWSGVQLTWSIPGVDQTREIAPPEASWAASTLTTSTGPNAVSLVAATAAWDAQQYIVTFEHEPVIPPPEFMLMEHSRIGARVVLVRTTDFDDFWDTHGWDPDVEPWP